MRKVSKKKLSVRHHKYFWYGPSERPFNNSHQTICFDCNICWGPGHYSANQMVLTWHWNMLQQANNKNYIAKYLLRFFDAKKIVFSSKLDKHLPNNGKNDTRNNVAQKYRSLTIFYAQSGLKDFINSIDHIIIQPIVCACLIVFNMYLLIWFRWWNSCVS